MSEVIAELYKKYLNEIPSGGKNTSSRLLDPLARILGDDDKFVKFTTINPVSISCTPG
jgi:hypothetical protein